MNVYYLMDFYSTLLFVLYVLFLDMLRDLHMSLNLSEMHSSLAEVVYVCYTIGIWIGQWLPNWATIGKIASPTGFTKIGSPFKI